MKKIIFLLPLCISLSVKGQDNLKALNNGLPVSEYLEKNFYSEISVDSCYAGIHYILIIPQKNGSVFLELTGDMNSIYKKRIETLLLADIWNKKLIKKCYRKKRIITQPIFLDITNNCTYNTTIFKGPKIDSLINTNFQKKSMYELAIKIMAQQHQLLVSSFNRLLPKNKGGFRHSSYYLLSPCYIKSRPLKKKVIM
jgi:hypothetical protein